MTYSHTIEMDTTAGPSAMVHVTFEAHKPIGPKPTIEGILSLTTTSALDEEDMQHLYEWLLQDKEEWE